MNGLLKWESQFATEKEKAKKEHSKRKRIFGLKKHSYGSGKAYGSCGKSALELQCGRSYVRLVFDVAVPRHGGRLLTAKS